MRRGLVCAVVLVVAGAACAQDTDTDGPADTLVDPVGAVEAVEPAIDIAPAQALERLADLLQKVKADPAVLEDTAAEEDAEPDVEVADPPVGDPPVEPAPPAATVADPPEPDPSI